MSYNNSLDSLRKRQQLYVKCEFTMLNSVHTAVGNLNGFIQSDKGRLQTDGGQCVSEFLNYTHFLQKKHNISGNSDQHYI